MGLIKGVLKEELENSLRLKKRYEESLLERPAGSIVAKRISGHIYYYLAYRAGAKVRFDYKGKSLSREFLLELEKSKRLRLKYRELIRQLNKRIRYLKKAISGKENV